MTTWFNSAFFAQASPAEIGTWVNVGMLFLNGAVAIVTILSVSRTAKREVTFAFEPASKEEFDRHVLDQAETLKALNHELAALRQEMRNVQDQLLLAGENRVSKLHERINTILEAVSELRGRVSTH
jgi:septal ring factor EnvC (AmiA/AmiB activator)